MALRALSVFGWLRFAFIVVSLKTRGAQSTDNRQRGKSRRYKTARRGRAVLVSVACTAFFGEFPQHFLPRRDRFSFPLHARLFVMLPLFQLGEDSRLLTFPFETAKRVFKALVLFDVYQRQSQSPPSV